MAVTIKDVAKLAGVATSTVSRTLKDQSNISEATKEKVRKAMKELGYVPNVSAQNLASRLTKNIGVVLPPVTDQQRVQHPFFMEAMSELSEALSEKQYTVSLVFAHTKDQLLNHIQMMHQQRRVDGFIILYSLEKDPVLDYLLTENIPFVVLGAPDQYKNDIRYVDNDNVSVGRSATQYLIEQGHENIIFIGRSPKEMVYQERYNGYFLEVQRAQLVAHPFFNSDDVQSIGALTDYIKEEHITAIVAGDDVLAVKLIPFLAQYDFEVGVNGSLISINNSVFSTLYHPYLTTIDIHVHDLAKQCALLMIELLNNKELPLTKYIIPHEVVVRESVIAKKDD